jgi:membrane associated rhomboid family serine protease
MLLGSSGAVYALLLAFAVLNPEARIFLYGILPVRAPILVLGYAGIEIASQLFSFRSSVAHLTHLAAFSGHGLFCSSFWNKPGEASLRTPLAPRQAPIT